MYEMEGPRLVSLHRRHLGRRSDSVGVRSRPCTAAIPDCAKTDLSTFSPPVEVAFDRVPLSVTEKFYCQ
jgi:hypothetical protein